MGGNTELKGPDLTKGIPSDELHDGGSVLGHAEGEPVLLVRRGGEAHAVGASCTHYGGPLAEGLVVGETVRCPWHHACFSLKTGEALTGPALNPIACWNVETRGDRLVVLGKKPVTLAKVETPAGLDRVVIVGGGAAGHAAAEMLRRRGYEGTVTIVSADPAPPVDRPNLSKDYLAGTAPEEWIPLRPDEFYREQRIELMLGKRVTAVDTAGETVTLESGETLGYDALILATGGEPVKLGVPGAELPHVHNLRSLADSRAIIAQAKEAKRAVVIGASFIGLEAAAALRTRGLEVSVVGPETHPLARVMGPEIGGFLHALHVEKGVRFHLGRTVTAIDAHEATLDDGTKLPADVVVVGIGIRPALALAQAAGLQIDRGVVVNEHLETSVPGVYAVGDVARWPDPRLRERIRVEHWVVAQRHGQIAARNVLGEKVRCELTPYFWSQHYDVAINYVGHAESWDRIVVDGSIEARDATVTFEKAGRVLAVATLGRDLASLEWEAKLDG